MTDDVARRLAPDQLVSIRFRASSNPGAVTGVLVVDDSGGPYVLDGAVYGWRLS